MSLTMGAGPFGVTPAGVFNFTTDGREPVLYWEPFPKRFRILIAGETLADSRDAHLLHERGQLPRVYLPRAAVALDRLTGSGRRTHCALRGEARHWSFGDRLNVAWSFERTTTDAPPMAGWVSFDLDKVDAWYEEDDRGYAHPRDPYHRVDVCRSGRHVVVRRDGVIVAETDAPAMLFETSVPIRYYIRPEDVRTDLFRESETVSQCPYKGPGQHWHLDQGGRVEDAAWTLSGPIGDAKAIPGWWSFYPDKLVVEVDGEGLPPR